MNERSGSSVPTNCGRKRGRAMDEVMDDVLLVAAVEDAEKAWRVQAHFQRMPRSRIGDAAPAQNAIAIRAEDRAPNSAWDGAGRIGLRQEPPSGCPGGGRSRGKEPKREEIVRVDHDRSGGADAGAAWNGATRFKECQDAALMTLRPTDFVMLQGKRVIKKTGWRKIACLFNISFEIKEKKIQLDEQANVLRAEFVVRAIMSSGRFSDSWGSCDRREKNFSKANHDIPSTAETRAKTRACQDLLGIGF